MQQDELTIAIPEEIKKFREPSDFISVKTTNEDGHTENNPKIPCFYRYMTHLEWYEFECYPVRDNSILPHDIFKEWIALGKQAEIIPEEVITKEEKSKNILTIPRNNYSRHNIFATLCFYRWSENQPAIAYTTVVLLRDKPHLSFFQVLHYSLASYCYQANHSFCNIGSANSVYGNKDIFIPDGLSIKWFFAKNTQDVALASKKTSTQTSRELSNLLNKSGLTRCNKNLTVSDKKFLLLNDWAELYDDPMPAKERIEKFCEEVKKKKKIH